MFSLQSKTEKRSSLQIMALVWVISAATATISISQYPESWQLQCAIGGIAALTLLRFSSIRDILFWVGLYFFFAFILKPVGLSITFEWGDISRSYSDLWAKVLYYQIVAFCAYVFGYVIAAWFIVENDQKISFGIRLSNVPSLLILYVGYALVVLSRLFIYEGYNIGLFSIISHLSPILFGVGLVNYFRSSSSGKGNVNAAIILLTVILFGDLIWALMTKAKLLIFLDIFSAAIVSSLLFRIRLWVVFLFGILAIVFIGIVTALRQVDYLEGANIVSLGFEYLMFRSNTFDTALRVFSMTPEQIPFWGSEILRALVETILIPIPFPGKPTFHVGVITSQLYYGYTEPVYLALGLATSWYVVDGFFWGVAAMFFHGLFISFVVNGLLRNVDGWRFMLWLAVFIPAINIEQSFLNNAKNSNK